jgi:hypothetical protein
MFFRAWLWLTTGMQTRSGLDPPQTSRRVRREDPHSPKRGPENRALERCRTLWPAENGNLARCGLGRRTTGSSEMCSRAMWQGCGVCSGRTRAVGAGPHMGASVWIPFHAAGVSTASAISGAIASTLRCQHEHRSWQSGSA